MSAPLVNQDSIHPSLKNNQLSFGSQVKKVLGPQISEDRLQEILAFCNNPLPLLFLKNHTPLTLLQVPKTQQLKKFDTNAFTKPLGTTYIEDIKLIASTLIQMEGLGLVKRVKDYSIEWMIDWTLTPLGEAVASSDSTKLEPFIQRSPMQTDGSGSFVFFSATLDSIQNKPSTAESSLPSFTIHPKIRQEILQDKINLLKGLEGTLPQGTTGWEVMQKIKDLTLDHPKFSFWLQGGLKEVSILHSFLSENKGDILEKLNTLQTLGLVKESRNGRWKLSGKGVKVLLSKTPMEASQLTAPEIEIYLAGEIQKIEHEKTARKMKLMGLKKTILASQKSLETLKHQWETLKKEALHLYDRSKDKTVQNYQESLSEKALETLLKSEVLQVQFEEETKLDEQKQQYLTLSENHYRDWLIQSNQILIQIQRAQSKLKQLATQKEMQLLESTHHIQKTVTTDPTEKVLGGMLLSIESELQKVEAKVPPEVQTADALLKSSIQQEDLESKMNEIRAQFPTLDTSSPIFNTSPLTEIVRPTPEAPHTLRLESNYPPGLPQNLEKRYAETKTDDTSPLDEAVSKQVAFWESKSRHGD